MVGPQDAPAPHRPPGDPSLADTREAGAAVPGGVERDLVFAAVERSLLGTELTPVTLDRFVVLHRIGRGAMGVVYAAHDPKLDRKVALKLVDASGHGSEDVRDARKRLEREAKAAANLQHPNVVTVFDTGVVGEQVYLAMEFVDGPTLGSWCQAEPRSWRDVVAMYIAAGRGLAAAHDAGVVHRDFKPDNVLVGPDGRPRVADFGLARSGGRSGPPAAERTSESSGSGRVTRPQGAVGSGGCATGSRTAIAGTPAYMAPEQFSGRGVGAHSDQFGFCVALWEALFGRRPFGEKGGAAELATRVANGVMDAPPRRHAVPARIVAAMRRGLSVDPRERFGSMAALVDALQAALMRRRRAALAGASAVVLGSGLAFGYGIADADPLDPCADADAGLAAVYDTGRRETLREALSRDAAEDGPQVGSGTWERVAPRLDAWASQWSEVRDESCRATFHDGTQSDLVLELSNACLDRALVRFDALLDGLGGAEPVTREQAMRSLELLSTLPRCRDREYLLDLPEGTARLAAEPQLGRAPDLSRVHADSFVSLDEAELALALGKPERTLEIASRVAAVARERDLVLPEARARWLMALAAPPKTDPAEIRTQLERALELALGEGPTGEAAMIAMLLADTAVEDPRRHEWARDHLRYAEGLARRSDLRAALLGRAEGIRGRLALAAGDLEAAHTHLERAVGMLEEAVGPTHEDARATLGNLGIVHRRAGRTQEAREIWTRLLTLQIEALGPSHQAVAATRFNLGVADLDARDLGEAAVHFEESRRIREARLGASHPAVAQSLSALGETKRLQGDLERGRDLQRRALEIREATLPPGHPEVTISLEELYEIDVAQGRLVDAQQRIDRSMEIRLAAMGPDAPPLAATHWRLGRLALARGEVARALPDLRRAVQMRDSADADPAALGDVLLSLAQALADDDACEGACRAEAKTLARRAQQTLATAGDRRAEEKERADELLDRL